MNKHVIVFLIGLLVHQSCADYEENVWQDPNAWEKDSAHSFTPNSCSVCDVGEEGALAGFYYKKLVANLFNKNTVKLNEHTGKLQRAMLFTLTPAQLDIIEKSTDIRDLDAVITAILSTARRIDTDTVKENKAVQWLLKDVFKDCFQIAKRAFNSSESRFGLFITGIVMLIWFIHKRYNKSVIAVVATVFFSTGYIFTYLECNRKIEADKLVTFIKESESPQKSWFNFGFRSTEQDKQIHNIQKQTKVALPFCRPDHVLMMYINEMCLNQLQLIVEKYVEIITRFKSTMGYSYYLITMIVFPFLFYYLIKLIFKYVVGSFISGWAGRPNIQQQPQQEQPQDNSNGDRISGENLRLLLELTHLLKPKAENPPLPSGVQDIKEALESAASEDKSDDSTADDSGIKSSDILETEKPKKES